MDAAIFTQNYAKEGSAINVLESDEVKALEVWNSQFYENIADQNTI